MIRTFISTVLLGCAAATPTMADAGKPMLFQGICDASAAEALTDDLVAVADDEQNSISVYSQRAGGSPLMVTKLSVFLQVDPSSEEADLEGAARIGDRIYWISSHGRNAKGKFRLSRAQFFATTATVTNGVVRLEPTGRPYHRLLTDLTQDPKLARFQLWNAAQMPPKSPGALNIEGLAATASGQLLIGFRNPIPGGQALIVPLLNPGELLELKSARFGDPVLLNLQGLGIRSMTRCGGAYLIVAGRFDEGGASRLFEWKGGIDVPRPLEIGRLHELNPEAIACLGEHADREALFVTSDDGMRNLDGKPCKQLKDPRQKFFRGLRLELPEESQ